MLHFRQSQITVKTSLERLYTLLWPLESITVAVSREECCSYSTIQSLLVWWAPLRRGSSHGFSLERSVSGLSLERLVSGFLRVREFSFIKYILWIFAIVHINSICKMLKFLTYMKHSKTLLPSDQVSLELHVNHFHPKGSTQNKCY